MIYTNLLHAKASKKILNRPTGMPAVFLKTLAYKISAHIFVIKSLNSGMNPIISFEKVVKQYKGREIISSLSLEIYHREVVGILGPSGVGKSTILKLIAGLETATKGRVQVDAKQIGYVFQEPRLFPWKTTLENVTLPLKAQGMGTKEADSQGKHYLKAMELDEFTEYYPAQLSGGMKQRVSLARAFAIEPEVLLLDEPFSSLDLKLRNNLLAMLRKRLQEQPMTVLYVSHAPEEVAQIASRVFMVHSGGKLVEQTL